MMTSDIFFQTLEKQLFTITSQQKQWFNEYHSILIEWNAKINLFSRTESDLWNRHFLNSATMACLQKLSNCQVIDLGSGGGFPAIILKILFPESRFVLIESVQKKANFLIEVVRTLKLDRVEVYCVRAEKISQEKKFARQFDFVTARAVASMKDLIPMSRGFLKKDGEMLFLKGRSVHEELAEVGNLPNIQIKVQPLSEIPDLGADHDGSLVRVKISP